MLALPPDTEYAMRLVRLAVLLGMVAFLSGPAWSGEPASARALRKVDALLVADREHAAAAAKTDMLTGVSAQFADSVVMPAGSKGLAEGRDAVIDALRGRSGIATSRVTWAPVGVGMSADGGQGYTYGFMQQTLADGSEVPLKYLAYWQRQGTDWRVIAYRLARRAAGDVDRDLRHVLSPKDVPMTPGNASSRDDAAATLADAERAFSQEAQRLGLEAAFAKFGRSDSMNMGGGDAADFVHGAATIAKAVSVGQPAGGSTLHWGPERVVVADSGDLGVSIGYIRHNAPDADGKPLPPIPFFTVWHRAGPDEAWRYVAE